jgi:hypothetical protein
MWIKFDKTVNCVSDANSKLIIEKLGGIHDFFDLKKSDRTRVIKKELSKLGHELSYKVYANRLKQEDINEIVTNPSNSITGHKFKNKEWLYDLHWYTEKDNEYYFPLTLPLVVECEWKHRKVGASDNSDKYGEVKFDFQKLVVSNSDLRLMIFAVNNRADLDSLLLPYFQSVISSYAHLENKAKFLFIAYYQRENTFYYMVLRK